jgi:hypothetical protein
MKWKQVRETYPKKWLLFEAIKAHTKADQRIVDQIAVIGAFSTSQAALRKYAKLHRESPMRELYVFHTSREKLQILERRWIGIRGLR